MSPHKILVHGSGIDLSKFAFKPRSLAANDQIRLVTTGRLEEKKGIEYSIQAVAEVVKQHPHLEYNIIGDGSLKSSLQELINRLGVSQNVKLVGWKQQAEIIEILDRSHLFLAPCVTAADGNQDAPVNTLKEAMAMGLPVISTYHGGIPELVEDGVSGFLAPERDKEAIAIKLLYLIEHPEIWEQMGMAGRRQVEAKYDMETLNDELNQIYHNLLDLPSPLPSPNLPKPLSLPEIAVQTINY
jgi:colanic acid/amylovoran biosynthesis glycosyltransferase